MDNFPCIFGKSSIIKKFTFWHNLSNIFKKSTWWALEPQMCGPKDMEDPVHFLIYQHDYHLCIPQISCLFTFCKSGTDKYWAISVISLVSQRSVVTTHFIRSNNDKLCQETSASSRSLST